MSGHNSIRTALTIACVGVVLLSSSALGAKASPIRETSTVQPSTLLPVQLKADPGDYTGWVRLYVVEPTARWKDNNSKGYHFGFLDFALDSAIVLPDLSRYHRSLTWDASDAGWSNVTEENIMVIAAIFNSEPHQAYSDPPSGNPFWAYYVDATAAAEAGHTDSNNTTPSSTHTVFVEEASTTWCPNCPNTNKYLHNVYESGNYNFHYASMILDMNTAASNWCNSHYNIKYIPTCYADGGDEVLVGGWTPEGPYQSMINACAQRAVSDIGLIIGVKWLGGDEIQIDVALAHGTPINTVPDNPPQPSGPDTVIVDSAFDYNVTGSDPESDVISYRWDWGDGDISEWVGPYDAGIPCTLSHSWAELGTYDVKVQSRDPWYESGWSPPLTVTVICCITRGDADGGGTVNVADVVYLVSFIFLGGPPPPCEEEGDTDGSGSVNVADVVFLVNYIFLGGPAPPPCE